MALSTDELYSLIENLKTREQAFELLGDREFISSLLDAEPRVVAEAMTQFKACGFAKATVRDTLKAERIRLRAENHDAAEWTKQLTLTTSGGIAATTKNAIDFLCNAELFDGVLGFDEFSNRIMILQQPPWNTRRDLFPCELGDTDVIECVALLESRFGISLTESQVHSAARVAAERRSFDPLKDYLLGLSWDDHSRLRMLMSYFGAEHNKLHDEMGKRFMIQAVARALNPGCQADALLVLEGKEGLKKSSALEILAGKEWFSSESIDIRSPEVPYQIAGKWIIELAEGESLRGPAATAIKAFITRRSDRYRPKYGRSAIDMARRCVFVQTTNDDDYLTSFTGNRRFWPVRVGDHIDVPGLIRDRDQLWAEAVWRYQQGQRYWFDDDKDAKIIALQNNATENRTPDDPWVLAVAELPSETSTHELMDLVGIPLERRSRADERRAGQVLRRAGYERKMASRKGVLRSRYFKT